MSPDKITVGRRRPSPRDEEQSSFTRAGVIRRSFRSTPSSPAASRKCRGSGDFTRWMITGRRRTAVQNRFGVVAAR